jgi:hypothetical protein
MCKIKDDAKTKLDKLIQVMERLARALESAEKRQQPTG